MFNRLRLICAYVVYLCIAVCWEPVLPKSIVEEPYPGYFIHYIPVCFQNNSNSFVMECLELLILKLGALLYQFENPSYKNTNKSRLLSYIRAKDLLLLFSFHIGVEYFSSLSMAKSLMEGNTTQSNAVVPHWVWAHRLFVGVKRFLHYKLKLKIIQ